VLGLSSVGVREQNKLEGDQFSALLEMEGKGLKLYFEFIQALTSQMHFSKSL